MLDGQQHGTDNALNLSAESVADRRRPATIGNEHNVGSRHHLEQLASDMLRRADTRRANVDFTWCCFGGGEELRKGFYRKRRMYRYDHWKANNARDRRDVAHEIEIKIIVERRVDCIRCAGEK